MQNVNRHQIKAARDLLGMTQQQLCDAARIPLITLRRLEGRPDHIGLVSETTAARVREVLEGLGVQFLRSGDLASGDGVVLRDDCRR